MRGFVSHDELNSHPKPKPKRLFHYYFAARLPPLPPAVLVGLPVGDLESPRFAIGPGAPRRSKRIAIVAVKDQNHPLVGAGIARQGGVIDQEPDIRPIRIALLDRQYDRLILRVAGAPGGVRQKRIVAIGP